MPFENKIENLKKIEKIELGVAYPLLGASRIANASRLDQSGADDGDIPGIAWDVSTAAYSGKSKDVTDQGEISPTGVTFSPDGSKMYIIGTYNNTVYQYTLTTAWDVSTASYSGRSKDVSAQDTTTIDVAFSSDGTKMYIVGYTSRTIFQYTLTTAWDVSTASYSGKSKDVSDQGPTPSDIVFSSDGTKMYILDSNYDTVYQYTLTTAWDVSTASYADKYKDVGDQETSTYGVTFSSDGSKMYIVGTTWDTVYQYTLTTAWDVSTASYSGKSKDVGDQETSLLSVAFSSDGTKMYIVGTYNCTVYQYTLSLAWTKTNDFILATRIYGSKGAYNFAYKLKWRNVTDGGVFADVGATGEISFSADTVLVDGQALPIGSKICGAQSGYTWQNGLENEGDNLLPDSGTYSLADEYYTELQWALDCNSAHDEDEYEFALFELTNGTSIGTCLASITMAITIVGGLSMKWNGVTISKWNGVVIDKLNGVD